MQINFLLLKFDSLWFLSLIRLFWMGLLMIWELIQQVWKIFLSFSFDKLIFHPSFVELISQVVDKNFQTQGHTFRQEWKDMKELRFEFQGLAWIYSKSNLIKSKDCSFLTKSLNRVFDKVRLRFLYETQLKVKASRKLIGTFFWIIVLVFLIQFHLQMIFMVLIGKLSFRFESNQKLVNWQRKLIKIPILSYFRH